MKKFFNDLADSAKEFKRVRVLATLAVMGALAIALKGVSIDLGPYASIGFSGIPNQVVDTLFGPVTGAVFGGVMDVLKFFIRPTGVFHFGFTFNAMLAAFIYGCFYYKKPVSLWRILAAKGLVELVVNLGFGTLWKSQLVGRAFFNLLPALTGWSLLNWLLNTIVFYLIAKGMEKAGVFGYFKEE